MRLIVTTILFFFGPMLILFFLRNALLLLRLWLKERREHPEPKVIDVTPVERTSRRFIVVSLLISLAIFSYAWLHMDQSTEDRLANDTREYVPAHIDADGKLIKSHFIEVEKAQASDEQAP